MSNYKNLEIEFIARTLKILNQYNSILYKIDEHERYESTLLVNTLLGLIIFPKEKTISYLPKNRLNQELLNEMGIFNSKINDDLKSLKDLIIEIRHSVAHFNIEFKSDNENFTIDKIIFKDDVGNPPNVIAEFYPSELYNFIQYYGNWIIKNIELHQHEKKNSC